MLSTEASSEAVLTVSLPLHSGFKSYMYICYLRSVLPVYWTCRVFNRSGISHGARKLAWTPRVIIFVKI